MVDHKHCQRLPAGRFYGTPTGAQQCGGFRLTESLYAEGAILPRHAHEQGHFHLVLSGRYEEGLASRRATRSPYTLLFLPADLPHEECHAEAGQHFMIEPDWRALDRFGEIGGLSDPLCRVGGEEVRLALRVYQEFLHPDGASALAVEGLGLELVALTLRRRMTRERQPSQWLTKVRDLLHARFAESLTLDEIAGVAGVHPVHLAQTFRRVYGCSLGQYVRELRVTFACRALARPDVSVTEVAVEAGFFDHSHFCRVFKRSKGVTPSVYQRQAYRRPAS
jgi:AraC family transcriptional regulator